MSVLTYGAGLRRVRCLRIQSGTLKGTPSGTLMNGNLSATPNGVSSWSDGALRIYLLMTRIQSLTRIPMQMQMQMQMQI